MTLEEIITAATEKRVKEIIDNALHFRDANYSTFDGNGNPTSIEKIVADKIGEIAKSEVVKYEGVIKDAIVATLSSSPTTFKISAYTEINVPTKTASR